MKMNADLLSKLFKDQDENNWKYQVIEEKLSHLNESFSTIRKEPN